LGRASREHGGRENKRNLRPAATMGKRNRKDNLSPIRRRRLRRIGQKRGREVSSSQGRSQEKKGFAAAKIEGLG